VKVLLRLLASVLACVIVLGCSASANVAGTSGGKIEALPTKTVPTSLLGLRLRAETTKEAIAPLRGTYVAATSLYSMRLGDVVQATLQITRMIDEAEYRSSSFRATMVNRVGTSPPRPVRLGRDTVYITSGTKQHIAMWFRGRDFFVLNVREDFRRPRDLIRRALEIRP
jgi:hypothetical protein